MSYIRLWLAGVFFFFFKAHLKNDVIRTIGENIQSTIILIPLLTL